MNVSESLTWINSSLNVSSGALNCMEIELVAGRALILSVLFLFLGFVMGAVTIKRMYSPRKKGKGRGLRGKGWKGKLPSIT